MFAVTVSTLPGCRGRGGLVIFRNFMFGGKARKLLVYRGAGPLKGAPKSRGAEDFDEFLKNVIDKYLKI